MNMFNEFKKIIKKISVTSWVLFAIVLIGIFLRTYHFRDWLYFYPDQARDATLTLDVVTGKTAWPLLGPIAASTSFKIGPIYYYFQIISAKIFGATPEAMAYPDLFFGILVIPLFYFFLKRIFSTNLSLVLTGLYSLSFYAIRYSRFAWNSNPIPFFVLLFLLALSEFLYKKETTRWGWIIALGIAFGVGVQLHTILLVLLPVMLFLFFLYSLKKSGLKVWQKWLVVGLIAIILNSGQLLSENKTHFKNSKNFIKVFSKRSPENKNDLFNNVISNMICHAQATTYFISYINETDSCKDFSNLTYSQKWTGISIVKYLFFLSDVFIGAVILIYGYAVLFRKVFIEQDERKKIFISLILVYNIATFFILLPIIGHNGVIRYLLPIFFTPFIFIGFLIQYLIQKKNSWLNGIAILLIALLIIVNFNAIINEAKRYFSKTRSEQKYVVLGEIEPMVNFIAKEIVPKKEAYILSSNTDYFWNYFKPLSYVALQKNILLVRVKNIQEISKGAPVFFIEASREDAYVAERNNREVENYENFGNIGIYKLKN